MIFADALPQIKTFLRPARLAASTGALLMRFIAASVAHVGRMSCSEAADAIRAQARHRSQLTRFLARRRWSANWAVLNAVAGLLLKREARGDGTWIFILDQTQVGHQGPTPRTPSAAATTTNGPKKATASRRKPPVIPATASSMGCC
jgi:hypothetical protein